MRRVGDYELLEVLGEGAFSKVKRVRYIPTGQLLVAKIIPKTNRHVENDVRLEISILRRLKHRNIVQLVEILESSNNYYIILEPVLGGDLCDLITGLSGPLPEQDVAALLIQLVAGLRTCHQNGVAHRDLKPENLLLGTNGVLKISDFGLSRLHRESNFRARESEYAHTLTGTLAYVAPEVFGGTYDAFRADIWSVGCIAYVLLTQNFPFGSTNDPHALEGRIRSGEVSTMPPHVSAEAKSLCLWLLSPRPEERPTLDEVAQHDFFKRNLPSDYLGRADNRKALIVQGANAEEFSSKVQEEAPSGSVCRDGAEANRSSSVGGGFDSPSAMQKQKPTPTFPSPFTTAEVKTDGPFSGEKVSPTAPPNMSFEECKLLPASTVGPHRSRPFVK